MPIYALDTITPDIGEDCWIAPDAVLVGRVRLLKGVSVWFGAVLRGDNDWITIGENSNVQDLSVIHVDPGQPVTIGAGVTIGHRVILHSATVGDNSLIGMGAVLLNGARIGRDSLVGAAALVTEGKIFEDGKLILGAPAKAVRNLAPEQIAANRVSSEVYVANGRRFSAGLVG
ncbi:MAG TPA: gamma carbonic anhydrase family protein [Rhizomicrobium sp.]|jgi:carbonic anhydrase/acetyltransferase-like protein (isoleucine patch superfamily)|nr:gamma carbonic anhydrase family protein [Rhizomicrobium sp.]